MVFFLECLHFWRSLKHLTELFHETYDWLLGQDGSGSMGQEKDRCQDASKKVTPFYVESQSGVYIFAEPMLTSVFNDNPKLIEIPETSPENSPNNTHDNT